jgi:glycosyltransferase involved in cell wall biosynthesis
VIGYNVPGLRDSIKDGINGCLVSKNYEALAQKMLEMIETDKWKDLSESALDYIKNIPSWQDNVEKFEGLVKSFIK